MVTLNCARSFPAAAMSTPPSRSALYRPAIPVAFILAALSIVGAQRAHGSESWSVASGDLQVRCRLTVGGSFNAVTSAVSGTLGSAAPGADSYQGELRVDLETLDTGIGLRNDHLRASYLETGRGPDFRQAVLSGIVLDDPPPASTGRHTAAFSATLALHGVRRTVEGEAELRRREGRMQVEASFLLSLETFDIPPPRYLGVGVRDAIEITVRFEAADSNVPPDGGP
jgi:polyisoprenoid-binding protein YceI